ncbi:MAG: sugar ABC transporter permease [bacterium]
MLRLNHRAKETISAYLFLSPTILGLIFLTSGAVLFAFGMSFCQWDLFSDPKFIGFGNYTEAVHTKLFWKSLWNSAYFTLLGVPLGCILVPLILASLLNQGLRGTILLRTLFFLPSVCSSVAIALLWTWLYNPQYGFLNHLLGWFGFSQPLWLENQFLAKPCIILVMIWSGAGLTAVIYLAALQNIPEHLYEAADIDGASAPQTWRYVTVPMVSPTIFFMAVIGTITYLQIFEQAYVMTKGGPRYATTTIAYYIFSNAFEWFRMGYASAVSFVLCFIVMILTWIQFRFERRWVHYE